MVAICRPAPPRHHDNFSSFGVIQDRRKGATRLGRSHSSHKIRLSDLSRILNRCSKALRRSVITALTDQVTEHLVQQDDRTGYGPAELTAQVVDKG